MFSNNLSIVKSVIDNLNIGLMILDSENQIVYWNKFMAKYSGIKSKEIFNKNLFEVFSYLPKEWLNLKLKSVRLLKNYSFVSWKQKPYLFKFSHNHSIKEDMIDYMIQDCTFIPIFDEESSETYICVVVQDMTDVAVSEKRLKDIMEINETLETIANYDSLTAIYNRKYLENQIEMEFEKSKRYGNVFCVVFFDLDFFKRVNDQYGHLAGDKVLKNVSDVVKKGLRSMDVFGRYGGEEFIVLLPETNEDASINLCRRLKKSISDIRVKFKKSQIKITASMGVVQFRPDIKNYFQLIHEADIALYKSKENGRNCITTFKTTGCITD